MKLAIYYEPAQGERVLMAVAEGESETDPDYDPSLALMETVPDYEFSPGDVIRFEDATGKKLEGELEPPPAADADTRESA